MEHSREVMRGASDDVTWIIEAGPAPDDGLSTMVTRTRGAVTATSGMGGPPLSAGHVVDTWIGQADGLPVCVLVRTAPDVERVVVGLASGASREVELSPVVADFGLRFGAVPLPDDDPPEHITINVANQPPRTGPLRWPPSRPA